MGNNSEVNIYPGKRTPEYMTLWEVLGWVTYNVMPLGTLYGQEYGSALDAVKNKFSPQDQRMHQDNAQRAIGACVIDGQLVGEGLTQEARGYQKIPSYEWHSGGNRVYWKENKIKAPFNPMFARFELHDRYSSIRFLSAQVFTLFPKENRNGELSKKQLFGRDRAKLLAECKKLLKEEIKRTEGKQQGSKDGYFSRIKEILNKKGEAYQGLSERMFNSAWAEIVPEDWKKSHGEKINRKKLAS